MKDMLKMQDYIKAEDRLKFYEDAVELSAGKVLKFIAAMLMGILAIWSLWMLSFPENIAAIAALLGIA